MSGIRSLFCLAVCMTAWPAFAGDLAGSKDHPAVTRYPGSEIRWYDEQAFEPYAIATGPVTGYRKIDDWIEIEGRTTRIYYELTGDAKTHTEVFANYERALRESGFGILGRGLFTRSSQANDVGSRKWLQVHYGRNAVPPDGIRLLQGSSTSAGSAFLAASKERAAGRIYVVLGMTQYSKDTVATMIDVIEVEAAETGLVTVNAEAMGEAIDQYGRVTLDGLFFDHDKATLKAESQPALEEIVRFLKARPGKKFFVVGHTDSTGSLAYNRSLSQRRAEAVIRQLADRHGIDPGRLEGHGVGPLAPVLSNSSDRGRAKNRRVELVERP